MKLPISPPPGAKVTMPTKRLTDQRDPAPYVKWDHTDIRATFARLAAQLNQRSKTP